MKQAYRIIGRGGLHDIIREMMEDNFVYDGFYDNKFLDHPAHKGSFSDIQFNEVNRFILGFASIRNMRRREQLFQDFERSGGTAINAISSRASIFSSVAMKTGNVICPLSNLGANVILGSNCIVFSNTTIEHDSRLGDNVNIAPGVSFGGGCQVGNNVFIGIGSSIRDQVKIGNNVVIGAGSLVLSDIPDNSLAYGSPARVVGPNQMYE